MKKTFTALAALSLISCAPLGLSGLGPAPIADRTVTDERVALGVETLYQGWRATVETGVDLGLIRGATAGRVQQLDRDIYAAVLVARQAYDAGNSATYAEAAARVARLIAEGSRLIQGDNA